MLSSLDLSSPAQQRKIEEILEIGKSFELTIACRKIDGRVQRLHYRKNVPIADNVTTISGSQEQLHPSYDVRFSDDPRDELDSIFESTYLVGSVTKIIMNMLMTIVSREKDGVSLDTIACEIFEKYRHKHPHKDIQELQLYLEAEPTIRDLLRHVKSFPPVNKQMIAPDGSGIATTANILKVANAEAKKAQPVGMMNRSGPLNQYSNANHVFAAVIIECVTGMPLHQAVSEFVFTPLKMEHSYFGWRDAQPTHYQMSSDKNPHRVRSRLAFDDLAECAPLGLQMTVGDLEILFDELFLALSGVESQLISQKDADDFFNVDKGTLAGFAVRLKRKPTDLADVASESPNIYLDQSTHRFESSEDWRHRQPRKDQDKDDTDRWMHHKSGYCDGCGCAVFLIPQLSSYLIVMAKGTGPLDVVHYVSWFLLQELLQVSRPVNVSNAANEASTLCSEALAKLEDKHLFGKSRRTDLSTIPDFLCGVYEGKNDEQRLEISNNTVIFGTEPKRSSSMSIFFVAKNQVLTIQLDGPALSIEVWSTWADMDFIVERHGTQISLSLKLRHGETHAYRKIRD